MLKELGRAPSLPLRKSSLVIPGRPAASRLELDILGPPWAAALRLWAAASEGLQRLIDSSPEESSR